MQREKITMTRAPDHPEKSCIKTLSIAMNYNHKSRVVWLNKMILSYEDTRLSLESREKDFGPQRHIGIGCHKAPSLPGLFSAAFTLTSPGTPMCLLLA